VEGSIESVRIPDSFLVNKINFIFLYSISGMIVDLQAMTSHGCLCHLLFMIVGSSLTCMLAWIYKRGWCRVGLMVR
jgi:hypothetical protein